MTAVRIVTCDRCNPDERLDRPSGRGIAVMSVSEALHRGWEREPGADIDGSDDTHYCVECLIEERSGAFREFGAADSVSPPANPPQTDAPKET